MRKTVLILALAACTLLAGGCDFFRTLAGRPTSADIAVKRQALELAAAEKEQALRDSISAVKAAQKAVEDSLAVMAQLSGTPKLTVATRRFDAATTAAIDHRYYVMVGAFADPVNVRGCMDKLEAAGFKAVPMKFLSGGFTAVAVNPTDRIVEAFASLNKVTELKFVPKDSWILDVSAL